MRIFHLTKTDYDEDESYAIIQGATFNYVTFWYSENITSWTPRGQIRTNYAQSGGIIKATFSFEAPTYEEVTIDGITAFRTKIRPILTATQTENLLFDLSIRRSQMDIPKPGINVWVYDVEAAHPTGAVVRIAKGWVEVDLESTR